MNNPLISVIVPIYKVENYLDKCVGSLVNQSYKNLEIILVDDGSPDGCGKKCDEYKKKDNRIHVIHKKNGGLSSARNAGLDIAKGAYIGFVDSDDYIHRDMYLKMMDLMTKTDCDVVECKVNIVRQGEIIFADSGENEMLTAVQATERYLVPSKSGGVPRVSVWSKLYKKSFWDSNRFPEGHIHEDYMLTAIALNEAKNVGIVNEGLYFHVVDNADSIMNSHFSERDLFLEEQYFNRIEYYKRENNTKAEKLAKNSYYMLILSLYWRCHYAHMAQESYYLKKIKSLKYEMFSSNIPIKRKLELFMVCISPKVYLYIRKMEMRKRKIDITQRY